ncbi:MAG: hypothetical protein KIT31_17370 [Deltaproteobacteria bacterium]|nr:hypothetical protein [Deltaproteobacteria bacterium]
MIPYEDLVVALQTWRSGAACRSDRCPDRSCRRSRAAPPPVSHRRRSPRAPRRTARPRRPPRARPRPHRSRRPRSTSTSPTTRFLEETSYDAEGNFTMSFGGGPPVRDSEATSIGMPPPAPPPRASDATMVGGEPSDTVDGLPPPPATPRNRGDW